MSESSNIVTVVMSKVTVLSLNIVTLKVILSLRNVTVFALNIVTLQVYKYQPCRCMSLLMSNVTVFALNITANKFLSYI